MLESEIREQLITQSKNIKFLREIVVKFQNIPEAQLTDEESKEYVWASMKLELTNCLEDAITRKRLIKEMFTEKKILSNKPNLFRELIKVAILELKEKNYIYWIDNRYSCKENISNKEIIAYLKHSFFDNQNRFGGYITRIDFKIWIIEVFREMNYAFTDKSIKSTVDSVFK